MHGVGNNRFRQTPRWGKDITCSAQALKRMFRTGDLQCHNASEDYRTGGRWWHWVYLAATFKQRENINTRAGRTHGVDVDTLLLCQLFYFRILSRAVDHESHDGDCDAILIRTLPTPETHVYLDLTHSAPRPLAKMVRVLISIISEGSLL